MRPITLTYPLYGFLFSFFQEDAYASQKHHIQFNPASEIIIFDADKEPTKIKEELSYHQFLFHNDETEPSILVDDIDKWYEGAKNGNVPDLQELLKQANALEIYPYSGKRCLASLLELKGHCQEHPDHILNKTEEFLFFLNDYEAKSYQKFTKKLKKQESHLKEELEIEELSEEILKGNINALQHLTQIYTTEDSDPKTECAQFFLEKIKRIYEEKKDTDNQIYLTICSFLNDKIDVKLY